MYENQVRAVGSRCDRSRAIDHGTLGERSPGITANLFPTRRRQVRGWRRRRAAAAGSAGALRLDAQECPVGGRRRGDDLRLHRARTSPLAAIGRCVSRQGLQRYPVDSYRLPVGLAVLEARSRRGRGLRAGRRAARHLLLLQGFRVQPNTLALPREKFRGRRCEEDVSLRGDQVEIWHSDRVNQVAVYYQSNLHRIVSEGDHVWKGTGYGCRHRIPIEVKLGRCGVLFHQLLKVTRIVVTKQQLRLLVLA